MARIAQVIQFKVLPKNFLVVDKWLSSLSEIYIDIEAASFSNEEIKEKIFYKDLRIIESYQIENLASAKTASGTVVDVSSKNPAMFTVTVSDWITDALSKDYLRMSIVDKLSYSSANLFLGAD